MDLQNKAGWSSLMYIMGIVAYQLLSYTGCLGQNRPGRERYIMIFRPDFPDIVNRHCLVSVIIAPRLNVIQLHVYVDLPVNISPSHGMFSQ